MWNKAQTGITLVELIIAMVIIAVGLGGIMVVYNTTVRDTASPLPYKQMVAVAEGMMEEIQRMPFTSNGPPTSVGCARDHHDDVLDYNGYNSANACDINGNSLLQHYAVSVTVVHETLGGISAPNVWRITVTVATGGNSVSLTGWRTNYAMAIP